MITSEEYLAALQANIGQVAKAMLNGETSFLEGAIELSSLLHQAELTEDPDLSIFSAVASETDSLPIGPVRQHWSKTALERLDPELQKAEEWAKQVAGGACESLARRFAT